MWTWRWKIVWSPPAPRLNCVTITPSGLSALMTAFVSFWAAPEEHAQAFGRKVGDVAGSGVLGDHQGNGLGFCGKMSMKARTFAVFVDLHARASPRQDLAKMLPPSYSPTRLIRSSPRPIPGR